MASFHLILGIVVSFQSPVAKSPEPRLDVRAERGFGGMQSDGWQHIALQLVNSSGQPISGRASLYEWESQVGAHSRAVLPFVVSDRQVLHFYPFRPPESPQPSAFVITLEDDSGRQILFDGGSHFVINGRSTRALRVDAGSAPTGDFRVAIWGETSPYLRTLVNEWNPAVDDLTRAMQTRNELRQMMMRGGSRLAPEAITVEEHWSFPGSFVGFGELDALFVYRADIELLTERQRRALGDWVQSGGFLVFVPSKKEHLIGPFWRELISIKDNGETTTQDDEHLRKWSERGNSQQVIHFLTTLDQPRPVDVTVSYDGSPVVYSVAVGFGRVWIVALDPDSHGGARHFKPLWLELLNQSVKYRLTNGPQPASLATQTWSPESDSNWLRQLGQRFGKSPSVEHLAVLILGYLLVIGPTNYFVLKRREASVLLIATVPALAILFGGVVLAMGFVSHGMRASTNQLELAIVSPEGNRAFTTEYVGVYGTTSDQYRLSFPRHLALRPLGEFVANASGGFDNPASFKLVTRDDRVWLEDWRLTFWQTRGIAGTECIRLDGSLTASRDQRTVTISNQTELAFEEISILSGTRRPFGPLKPFETQSITLPSDEGPDSGDRGTDDSKPNTLSDTPVLNSLATDWPEAETLLAEASRRLSQRNSLWILGLTRKPVYEISSLDARRHLVATVFAWPVVSASSGSAGSVAKPTPE